MKLRTTPGYHLGIFLRVSRLESFSFTADVDLEFVGGGPQRLKLRGICRNHRVYFIKLIEGFLTFRRGAQIQNRLVYLFNNVAMLVVKFFGGRKGVVWNWLADVNRPDHFLIFGL